MSETKMASDEVADRKLDEFTLFPKLPLEIQLNTWKYAVPGPRVIKVKVFAPQTIYDPDYVVPWKVERGYAIPLTSLPIEIDREEKEKAVQGLVLSTKTKSPGFLFACKASRAVGLKQYTTCLKLGKGKETRFNPENDTVLLYNATTHYLQPLPGYMRTFESWIEDRINFIDTFSGVRNLAISGFDIVAGRMKNDSMTWLISRFQTLKSLFVLVNDERHLTTSSLNPLAESDEQLRLYTQDELGQKTWGKMRGLTFIKDEYCPKKARDWKAWATGPRGDKSYVTDWENLQVKPAILVSSSARP